ncbi:MAG TPA: SpoIIE family protein phosphatase, partial [Vicinamibacteria bacterium]
PRSLRPSAIVGSGILSRDEGEGAEILEPLGLEILCPILKADRVMALLGLGPRAAGNPFGVEERSFLQTVAACAAIPIENGLVHEELRQVNRKLSVKVFQLNNLFDISRELTASFDESSIQSLVSATLMGHLGASRCAIFLRVAGGFSLAHARGLKDESALAFVPDEALGAFIEGWNGPHLVSDLPAVGLREILQRGRMSLVVPLGLGARVEGFMAVGERVTGGVAFSEEDGDFAMTLARQAQASLESVRLQRVRVEKQRQDHEMRIARDIQRSLLPKTFPSIRGFEIAAESRSCHEVGGDHYDVIPLPDGRVALAIADVSGKGAPASLLMASVHAWLRALAGSAPPRALLTRLNSFLYQHTEANRYVTLFYGELDSATHRLAYVNAGHIPPYVVGAGPPDQRLTEGGPVLGIFQEADFVEGEAELHPGDVLAMVTDGVTEAASPDDREFGDDRVLEILRRARPLGARRAVAALVQATDAWSGSAGPSDDMTVLVASAGK